MMNLGDFTTSDTLYVPLATYDSNGASVTLTGLAVTDIEIYKDGSVTQRASDAGYTLLDTDGIDFDGVTGLHGFSVDLSDNTDAGFYADGSQYWLVVNSVTVDSQTVVAVYFFTIGRYLKPTTSGRTLDVAATGEAGVDLGNVTGTLTQANVGWVDANSRVDVGSWLGTAVTTSTTTSKPEVDVNSISDDATAANNLELDYDGTGYAKANSTIGTCTTNTDMITAAAVNAEVDTALADIHLDHLLAVDYDPAAKPGTATALLNELVESNAGVSRFTAAALDQTWSVGTRTVTAATNITSDGSAVTMSSSGVVGTVNLVNTTTTNTDMRGTDNAALASVVGALADAAAAGDPTASDTLMQYAKQLVNVLVGTTGVTTYPAAAAPANNVSLSEIIRAIYDDTNDVQPKLGTVSDLGGGATIGANLSDIAGPTFSTTTDTLEGIRDRGDAAWVTGAGGSDRLLMVDTTIATLSSQTSFTLTAGSTDDDAYNGCTIVIEDVSTSTQKAVGIVDDYTGATKTVTLLEDPGVFTMAATDKVYVLAEKSLKPTTAANYHVDVEPGGTVGIDWANVANPTTAVDLAATDIQLCDTITTYTGNTVQTGDSFARLGAPAGASVSADVAAVKAETALIVADTNELQTDWADGGRLDLLLDACSTLVATDITSDGSAITMSSSGVIGTVNLVNTTTTNTDMRGTDSVPAASATGTADSGSTTTMVDAARTEADDDYWKGSWIRFTSGTISGQARLITGFTAATDTITFTPATTQAVATNTYEILPAGYVEQVQTLSGHTAQTGDSFARLGAPAGASVSADVAAVKAETALIVADTNELQTDWADGGRLDLLLDACSTLTAAAVNAEVDTALADAGLDHLVSAAVVGTDVADNSIVAKLVSSSATADWDDFVNTTDSLQAVRDHIGDGTNLTEAGGTGDHLSALPAVTVGTINDGAVDATVVADIFSTTALTESYAALGAAGTPAQILYFVQQFLVENGYSGTTGTVKKLDGATTAATTTLNDGTTPTSITRAS